MELSGAEILIQSLSDHSIDTIFGYPGSCVMPVLDHLYDNEEIKFILVRHEQGAVHAACGYAQLANKPGVVLVTSGPGATNTVTGIADAYYNGIPLLVITGQVSSHLLGTDAFQEADTISITASITKWNYQIRKTDQIADAVKRAFEIALSGCPGPVLLDITKDAQTEKSEYNPTLNPLNCGCFSGENPVAMNALFDNENTLYGELIRIFKESGNEIVFIIDTSFGEFYPNKYLFANKALNSGMFCVPGFGLPAAIGASCADVDKTICLVAGNLEFQAALKELGVIKQQGLNIKMIVCNTTNSRFEVKNPDFMQLISAYGIKGDRISEIDNLSGSILKMLNAADSYLLEIR